MSTYKDATLDKMKSVFSNIGSSSSKEYSKPSTSTTTTQPTTTNSNDTPQTSTAIPNNNQTINPHTGIYKNYYLGLVNTSQGDLGGSGCYDNKGNFIVLINNKNATNPTYSQLVDFLQKDKTDEFPYTYTLNLVGMYYGTAESHVDLNRIKNIIDRVDEPSNPCVCADFAERLHNNAEMAGIRCAYVSIDITGYSDPYRFGIPSNGGHACNAFQTTDRGLIYVDATGMPPNIPHPMRPISTVTITVGQEYIPISLFPEAGWQPTGESMGIVTNIFMVWDGAWNN
jgi:hypothetical protein